MRNYFRISKWKCCAGGR